MTELPHPQKSSHPVTGPEATGPDAHLGDDTSKVPAGPPDADRGGEEAVVTVTLGGTLLGGVAGMPYHRTVDRAVLRR